MGVRGVPGRRKHRLRQLARSLMSIAIKIYILDGQSEGGGLEVGIHHMAV